MLAEESTVPEEAEDVFSRVDMTQTELLTFMEECFAQDSPVLSEKLQLQFIRAEVTQHDSEDTYHFLYASFAWEEPFMVRSMLTRVGSLLSERLESQTALTVILPGD